MKKILFLLYCSLACQMLFAQKNLLAERFFSYVNSYQRDSLDSIIHTDFLLNRSYSKITHPKSFFLYEYLDKSKAIEAKFNVVKEFESTQKDMRQFLVEDESLYIKYLEIENPLWIMTLMENEGKIVFAAIDTIESYSKYMTVLKSKNAAFVSWLKANHPNETLSILNENQPLFMDRLKAFSKRKK